jgi:hypothetical protein
MGVGLSGSIESLRMSERKRPAKGMLGELRAEILKIFWKTVKVVDRSGRPGRLSG